MQEDNHIFQGLRRDNHQIRQESKFLWDALNIRLTNRDDSTLLSLTNERGTTETGITLQAYYVGHCIVGEYLVIFTAEEDGGLSYIYRIKKTNKGFEYVILFQGDLYLSPYNPIQTLGYYENSLIQKVYWVDGVNQPRMINIAKPELVIPQDVLDMGSMNGVNLSVVDESSPLYPYLPMYLESSFDFTRTIDLHESIYVNKIQGYGQFSPGVIQYAFSYYDKYGQESSIFFTTPLQYISPQNRGGSPDEKIANSFEITIMNPDTNFSNIRIYSIHRTSIDATPTVKIVGSVSTEIKDVDENGDRVVTFTDTGSLGDSIDPTQLLYVGGTSLIAGTISHKDGTLFLGNIKQENTVISDIKDSIKDNWRMQGYYQPVHSGIPGNNTYYEYNTSLTKYCAGFKVNEIYRIGVQVQDTYGKWSEPIYLTDTVLNYDYDSLVNGSRQHQYITLDIGSYLYSKGVRRIRACVVFPKTFERNIICQGILNPTVYSVLGRSSGSTYSQSSWFFRPSTSGPLTNTDNINYGSSIQFQHNKPIIYGPNRGAEVQSSYSDTTIDSVLDVQDSDKYKSMFFVDENIVTLHSPDLEFDTQLSNTTFDGVKLNIIGYARLGAISGDISLQTSSPALSPYAGGFDHKFIGYQTSSNVLINGGLISGLFYQDSYVNNDFKSNNNLTRWMLYPWQKSGSINNDSNRSDSGAQSSILSKKKISNLKFFTNNSSLDTIFQYDITTPQLFSSNELSLLKLHPEYIGNDISYMGNIDTLISSNEYPLYNGGNFQSPITQFSAENSPIKSSSPVRIKYKSTPHLVFSLSDKKGKVRVLPRHQSIPPLNNNASMPEWAQSKPSQSLDYDYIVEYYGNGITAILEVTDDNSVGNVIRGTNNGGSYLSIIEKNSKGQFTSSTLTKTTTDNSIVLFKSGYTKLTQHYKVGNIPEGVVESDFKDGYLYIGEDKYYRVTFGKEKNNVVFTLISKEEAYRSKSSSTYSDLSLQYDYFGRQGDTIPPYLLIAELQRTNVKQRFGGTSDEAIQSNLWFPAGSPTNLSPDRDEVNVLIEYGDTWYSRYDCLKTYPFTQEDENQVIEIGSFMCETRVNIDGRYDRNRGQLSNLNMSPQNFNLFNEVYTQKDNFFNYRVLDEDYYKQNTFPNQITWSLQKTSASETDTWTDITLANILDMDGSKGDVTNIDSFNELLICFQEKAISQILFNSRVQIPTSEGVPIEISNGYKVEGSRFISDTIGCQDKFSVVSTPSGIFFIDNNTSTIWMFNGQLNNISDTLGMRQWLVDNHCETKWTPIPKYNNKQNGIRTFYDSKNGDIYFSPGIITSSNGGILEKAALCYSEKLGQFTSLMSYGGVYALFQYNDSVMSLYRNSTHNPVLWENFTGEYNKIYGNYRPFYFSFISNQNPTYTKIFDTVEMRTDVYSDDGDLLNNLPFNYISVENEYQSGQSSSYIKPLPIYKTNLDFKKKFRVWRGLIPRNRGTRQRIRNPWTMITLGWNPIGQNILNNKVVLHDVSVKYSI